MTRSVWRLFCSPTAAGRPWLSPFWSISIRRRPIAGGAALAKAQLDQPALPCEDLGGQLAAVLAGHRALDALDDGGDRAAVVLELLGAVVDVDAGPLADVLVVGALVGVLEAAPAADVVDEDGVEVGLRRSGRPRSAACSASRPSMRRPLLPASAYVRTISIPRCSAYSRITSAWFSVEYCWCSVDMRTYSAARVRFAVESANVAGGGPVLSMCGHWSGTAVCGAKGRGVVRRIRDNLTQFAP